ncbi:MAG: hypothetical protein AMJ61_15945 [Desulfobacterales bacterium SG8_35_2]|nr:MAG: hypothetical protein AMJ61_15945 [Desulfobacterales bacterium SG8_35_2]
MQQDDLFSTETTKSNTHFVKDLGKVAEKYGFIIHNEDKMAMANTFGSHGVEVAEGFDLHMIQLCKPEKAAKSLAANPERAILMPKFIITFTKNNKTQIRFLRFSEDNIRNVVNDDKFPGSLAETYIAIEKMISEAM